MVVFGTVVAPFHSKEEKHNEVAFVFRLRFHVFS